MRIGEITHHLVLEGRRHNVGWFHPKHAVIPPQRAGDNPTVLCTLSTIVASDVFSPLYEIGTTDLGKSWTRPVWHLDTLGRHQLSEHIFEGICDFVPGYHRATGKILGIGHTVRYVNHADNIGAKHEALTQPTVERYGVWSVRDVAIPEWTPWQILRPPAGHPEMLAMCTPGCSQRVELPDGNLLVPFRWRGVNEEFTRAGTMLLAFDGQRLEILDISNELPIEAGRGAAEPSIVEFGGKYFMTIRAEDGRMWHAESLGGLKWHGLAPWCWDDGSEIATDQTQQHWVKRHDALYLTYTRKTGDNDHIIRSRAPLFIAQVDPARMCLIRTSEQVLMPEQGAGLGNFMVENVTPHETWVMAGEFIPREYNGDLLLAKIHWEKPNKAV